MNKQKIQRISIITVALLVFGFLTYRVIADNALFCSFSVANICKQISNEIPVGTSADDTLACVKDHSEWSIVKHCDECEEIASSEGEVSGAWGAQSCYSMTGIPSVQGVFNIPGAYYLKVKLGTEFLGRETYAEFIFDEDMKLTDIVVYKSATVF